MNLRPFKLNRVYLDPLNISKAGDFSWIWILKDFIQVQKEDGKSSSYVDVHRKTANWEVSRRSRAVDVEEMCLNVDVVVVVVVFKLPNVTSRRRKIRILTFSFIP